MVVKLQVFKLYMGAVKVKYVIYLYILMVVWRWSGGGLAVVWRWSGGGLFRLIHVAIFK